MSERDPIHQLAYHDAEAAWSIAKSLWGQNKGTPEAFQATFATTLIHIQNLRKSPQSPSPKPQNQAGHASAPASARPAPAPAPAAKLPPDCPTCGGAMWDNREGKQNPKAPDFKCKDKNCKDEKGFVTSLWMRDLNKQKNTAYAEAHAVRDAFDAHAVGHKPPPIPPNFEDFPPQLADEGDLPF